MTGRETKAYVLCTDPAGRSALVMRGAAAKGSVTLEGAETMRRRKLMGKTVCRDAGRGGGREEGQEGTG